MLFVLFQLGNERFALEARRVVELVPLLELKKIPHAPPGLAGVFVYRGQPVAAVDLCALILGRPAAEHFSTRILIINQPGGTSPDRRLGLIVERATETFQGRPEDLVEAQIPVAGKPFVGHLLKDAEGVIQLLDLDRLLQQERCVSAPEPILESAHVTD
ncbi:MAG TPA: chemotaxis protein CheW [Verrucomicrobiota bacterium]|nr:chemotaxis protein CheW [Verrucomicrobiota bacterium]HNT14257.1 chemotaxis protein CheW [Verrucomicrobiota bacterium]